MTSSASTTRHVCPHRQNFRQRLHVLPDVRQRLSNENTLSKKMRIEATSMRFTSHRESGKDADAMNGP